MKTLNINRWDRREHFEFFNTFSEPFFGLATEIDCQNAYRAAKESGLSFFALYLHTSLMAVNAIESFRYRIQKEDVVIYDKIHASTTLLRENNTFAFSYIEHSLSLLDFSKDLQKEVDAVNSSTGLRLNNDNDRDDIIHYSSVPWTSFTSVSHARQFSNPDSCPKIMFGKTYEKNNTLMLPISIHAHHGLMDGFHVAQFLECFQDKMNNIDNHR